MRDAILVPLPVNIASYIIRRDKVPFLLHITKSAVSVGHFSEAGSLFELSTTCGFCRFIRSVFFLMPEFTQRLNVLAFDRVRPVVGEDSPCHWISTVDGTKCPSA